MHGGLFISGSAADFGIRGIVQNFVDKGLVVVSINYRIGAYGFFGFDDIRKGAKIRGIYDQLIALNWIQKHILTFGGDPENINLFGFDSGACSASLLTFLASNPNIKNGNFEKII